MARRERVIEATCPKCGMEFYEQKGLLLHMAGMHPVRTTPLERNVELEDDLGITTAVKGTISPAKRG
jgi:hypothetical protein